MADWDSMRAALAPSGDVSVLSNVLSRVKHILLDLERRGWNAVDATFAGTSSYQDGCFGLHVSLWIFGHVYFLHKHLDCSFT